jgi:hypothetical protein
MIKASFKESWRLIGRSKKEAAFFCAAWLLASVLYPQVCAILGLEGAYSGDAGIKTNKLRGAIAYLPGIVLTAWVSAGLAGRLVMDALKGEAVSMAAYGNGWFLRKFAWDLFFMLLMSVPLWFLSFGSKLLMALFALVWLAGGIFLAVRSSLWINISVAEKRGLPEAVKLSFALTRGREWTLVFMGLLPMAAGRLLGWSFGELAGGGEAASYYANALFEAPAALAIGGAFAAFYASLAVNPAGGPPGQPAVGE